MLGDMRKQLADRLARFAVVLEFPRRLHQRAHLVELQGRLERQRLAIKAIEFWLGIEGVDVRDAPVHEQEDDAFGARRVMRLCA